MSPTDEQLANDAALDPRSRDLLDAFRAAKAAPVPARDRVWARVERSTAAGSPFASRVAKGAAVLAIVGGLAWLAWPRPEADVAWSVPDPTPAPVARVAAPTPPADAPSAVAPAAAPAPAPAPAPEAAVPDPALEAKPAARTRADRPQPAAESAPAAAPEPERGPSELELIARAKKALARGDAKATLAATGEHARRFPSGMLLEERALLEIEARCALGQRDQVERLRGAFLAAHAASPLADRVRHSCKEND